MSKLRNRIEMNLFIRKTYCQNWYEIYHPIREIYANLEDEIETQLEEIYGRSTLQPGETFRDKIKVQQVDGHGFEFSSGSGFNKKIFGLIQYNEKTKELSFINKGRIPDLAILLGGSTK
jgi:hypothetical protein